MPKTKSLTGQERRACFAHAKDHIVEAIEEALTEESHSVMTVDDGHGNAVPRGDMQALTLKMMEVFLKHIKKTKYAQPFIDA